MTDDRGSAMVVGLVAVVVGLALGFGGATVLNSNRENQEETTDSPTKTAPSADTQAAQFRSSLSGLMAEHVALAAEAIRAGHSGLPTFPASAAALDENSVAIAKLMGTVYGPTTETKFLETWRSHITQLVNYTTALSKNDKAAMDKAVADLTTYSDAIASLLAEANPEISQAAVQAHAKQHVSLLKDVVDAYAAKDYAKSFKTEREAVTHISQFSELVGVATVAQYPDKF